MAGGAHRARPGSAPTPAPAPARTRGDARTAQRRAPHLAGDGGTGPSRGLRAGFPSAPPPAPVTRPGSRGAAPGGGAAQGGTKRRLKGAAGLPHWPLVGHDPVHLTLWLPSRHVRPPGLRPRGGTPTPPHSLLHTNPRTLHWGCDLYSPWALTPGPALGLVPLISPGGDSLLAGQLRAQAHPPRGRGLDPGRPAVRPWRPPAYYCPGAEGLVSSF